MIWESTSLMTLFDVVIIAMSAAGLAMLTRQRLRVMPARSGMFPATFGLGVLGLFYLVDLVTIWILPLFIPRAEAMSFMRTLHLNYLWIVTAISVGLIFFGTATLVRRLSSSVEEINESENRYRSLFDNVPLSIWEEDYSEVLGYLEGLKFREIEDFDAYLCQHPEIVRQCASLVTVLAVNEGALRLHEVEDKDELLSDISDMFTEESYAAFGNQLQAIQRGDLKYRTQAKLKTAKGLTKDVILDWQVAPGHEESLSRVFVTLTDITDRVRDQEALRELNVNLEQQVVERTAEVTAAGEEINRWFEMSSDMICILGVDGYIKRLNRAWESTLGYSTEELLAEPLISFVHPDDIEATLEARARVVSLSERMSQDTNRYRHKDGSFRWLAWSAQGDPELGLTYAIGRDVTEEVDRTESLLSESLALERLVAERTSELQATNERLEQEVAERKRSGHAAEQYALQQECLAGLGRAALVGGPIDKLMDELVACVASILRVEYSNVLELLPSGEEFLFCSGVGWKDGLVGHAKIVNDKASLAGFALITDSVVFVEDLRSEKRFKVSPLLTQHNVVSGMSVIIRGKDRPFGILGVYTSSHRSFTEADSHFVRGAANILADAFQRAQAETELQETADALARINAELVGFNRLAVGRELRMVELKRQVNALLEKSGAPPAYDITFAPEVRLSGGDDLPAKTVQA